MRTKIALLVGLLSLGPANAAEYYSLTVLSGFDTFGDIVINDLGQVAGNTALGRQVAVYSNGVYTPIGPAAGFTLVGGINNSGQVAGATLAGTYYQAAAFTADSANTLNLPGSTGSSFASGINNSGQIVGNAELPGGSRPFLYANGSATWLGGNDSWVTALNNHGVATGFSNSTAAIFSNGNVIELGQFSGGYGSYGTDINDHGMVVGTAFDSATHAHAFAYVNGQMVNLDASLSGDVQSLGVAVNNQGEAVGQAQDSLNESNAFVYSNGQARYLNELIGGGWRVVQAIDINNQGMIAALAVNLDTNEYSNVLLAPVPEAPPALMLLGGLAVLGAARCRMR